MLAAIERGQRSQRRVENRRVRGIGAQLLADDVAELSARARDEDHAANSLGFCAAASAIKRAFAVAKHPDAFRPGLLSNRRDPCVGVGRIVGDRHLVGIGDRGLASEQSPLVDSNARDALRSERLGKQPIGRCSDAQRIVAVAIGRARSRDDENDGRPFACILECSGERALRPGRSHRNCSRCGCRNQKINRSFLVSPAPAPTAPRGARGYNNEGSRSTGRAARP